MRESTKAALGGIISALCIVILLSTYLSPILAYTAPAFAGVLLIVIVSEMGYKRAFAAYAVVSVLSVLFVADREAAVFFVFFFGYYPILEHFIRQKALPKLLRIPIKLIIFNLSLFCAVGVSSFIFHVDYSEFSEYGKAAVFAFAGMMNVVFAMYDLLLNRLQILYQSRLRKKLLKLLKN